MPKSTPINEALSQELLEAVKENDEKKVQQLLLCDDVDVNVQDNCGNTPLHNACSFDFEECVKLLLTRDDIKINVQNKMGETPFHLLSFYNHENLFALFLDRLDLDVNIADDFFKEPPLHVVCKLANSKKLALLLKRPDIDVSLRNKKLQTPLDVVKSAYEEEKITALAEGYDTFVFEEHYIQMINMLENFKPVKRFLSSENQEKLSNLSPIDIKMPKNKAFLDECAKTLDLPQIFVGLAHKQQSALLDVYAKEIRANDKYSEAIGQIVYATHKAEKEAKRQNALSCAQIGGRQR